MTTAVQKDKYMHIFDHIRELRKRLFISIIAYVVSLVIAFVVYNYIVELFIQFYSAIEGGGDSNLYVNSIVEGMTTRIKVSLIIGLSYQPCSSIQHNCICLSCTKKEREAIYWNNSSVQFHSDDNEHVPIIF